MLFSLDSRPQNKILSRKLLSSQLVIQLIRSSAQWNISGENIEPTEKIELRRFSQCNSQNKIYIFRCCSVQLLNNFAFRSAQPSVVWSENGSLEQNHFSSFVLGPTRSWILLKSWSSKLSTSLSFKVGGLGHFCTFSEIFFICYFKNNV